MANNSVKRGLTWLGVPLVTMALLWYVPWYPIDIENITHGTIHMVELAGKQVPLPKGLWLVASSGREAQNLATGPTVVERQLLLGVDNNSINSFVLINTNATPAPAGWGVSQDCKNSNHPFKAVLEQQNNHYSCVFISTSLAANKTSGPEATFWTLASERAKLRNWQLSNDWVVVGIRLADRLDVVDVRYGFSLQTPPKKGGVDTTTEIKVLQDMAVEALRKWQTTAVYLVERGFRRQLDQELPLSQPNFAHRPQALLANGGRGGIPHSSMLHVEDTNAIPTQAAGTLHAVDEKGLPPVVASRLQQLLALYNEGWLSRTEFEAQHILIREQFMAKSDVTINIWTLGAMKTAGHTTQSLLWMWGVNYLFMGDAYLAGSLALTKTVISPIRYYLEEAAWNTWGPRRNPTLPVVDFNPEQGQ